MRLRAPRCRVLLKDRSPSLTITSFFALTAGLVRDGLAPHRFREHIGGVIVVEPEPRLGRALFNAIAMLIIEAQVSPCISAVDGH